MKITITERLIFKISGKTFMITLLVTEEHAAIIFIFPIVWMYTEKVAIPADEVADVWPDNKLPLISLKVTTLDVRKLFPSSPYKSTVIIKLKFWEGVISLEVTVKLYTKLITVKLKQVYGIIPVEDAVILKTPAESIRKLLNVAWPLIVDLVIVPLKLPEGFKLRTIVYGPLTVSRMLVW